MCSVDASDEAARRAASARALGSSIPSSNPGPVPVPGLDRTTPSGFVHHMRELW